jgi:putative flippase GtrA
MSPQAVVPQLTRFAIVGVATNVLAYLAYLALTAGGLAPKAAMSAVYVAAAGAGFFANRHWSFAHDGARASRMLPAGLRYLAAHAAGYLLNLVLLHAGTVTLGWPHQAVQAAAIVVVAGFLFLVFRRFVFAPAPDAAGDFR